MKTYRVDLKPISPYFFGNEKTFPYTGQMIGRHLSNSYYIRSEHMPSQTTVLGALRYLFLAHKNSTYTYSAQEFSENAKRVGENSFDIATKEAQDFGIIEKLSPVFLYHKTNGVLIPTPFDHNKTSESGEYTPFENYDEMETPDGKKLYTVDYDAKAGLTDSYMVLDTGKVIPFEEVFSFEDRVGIAIEKTEKAFFKKKYAILARDYCFSVYLTISDDCAVDELEQASNGTISVFMGQGKSAFLVSFTEQNNTFQTKISAILKRALPVDGKMLYFMSDSVLEDSCALYAKTLFGVVKTKDYRAFGIAYKDSEKGKLGSFQKKSTLYKLIAAGSVLIVPNAEDVVGLFKNPNAEKIGLNQIVK